MNKDYNYDNYHTSFLPQLSSNVSDILNEFNLSIDTLIFEKRTDKRGVILVCKK